MKKVAIGCGIAALVVLALIIAVFVFGARWMKGQLADMQRYEETTELMVSTYGAPEEFLPPADGVYDPERIALFVRMRGEIADAGASFVADAEELATKLQQHFTGQAQAAAGQAAGAASLDDVSVWADTQTSAIVVSAPPIEWPQTITRS